MLLPLFSRLWLHIHHKQILQKLPTGVCILKRKKDTHYIAFYANPKAVSILGYNPVNELPSREDSYNFKSIPEIYEPVSELKRIIKINTAQWGVRYFEQECLPYDDKSLLVTFTDIHDTYINSISDPLTSLYTRVYLEDAVESAIARTDRGETFTYIRLDLDNFKNINNKGGHLLGDKALKAVAARLRESLRTTDTIARVGGDEFACLLPGGLETNMPVINRLHKNLTFDLAGKDVNIFNVSASIGVTAVKNTDDAYSVDYRADKAQLEAKITGRIEIQ